MSSILPDVTESIQDGALGIIPESTDNIALVVGVCSQGTTNVIQSFGDKKSLVAALGSGPLVDAAALILDTAGGPVDCVRIAATTAGAAGAVTTAGTGTATMTVAGAALDEYVVQIVITAAGANLAALTAAFKYTLDGGNNWSSPIAMPVGGVYAIPGTNITVTFADGTFVVADTYSFNATQPLYAGSDLTTTMAAILADPREWNFLFAVGPPASESAAATLVGTLDTIMSSAETSFRFAFALVEIPKDTDANIIAALANTTSKRVMGCAGTEMLVSTVNGLVRERSSAYVAAARIAAVPIHEDLGRVRTGPVLGVSSLVRDERATPGLDAARLTTLRTIVGQPGYYITNGRMLAPAGSDFTYVQNRRVMDKACKVARDGLMEYLNDSVRLNADGTIQEIDARAIEAYVNAQLDAELVSAGHASSTAVLVDRTHNIASDSTMPVTVRILPLGYAKFITVDIGFTSPALQPKAA